MRLQCLINDHRWWSQIFFLGAEEDGVGERVGGVRESAVTRVS